MGARTVPACAFPPPASLPQVARDEGQGHDEDDDAARYREQDGHVETTVLWFHAGCGRTTELVQKVPSFDVMNGSWNN